MISETKFRVENHFRVGIFEIFHFQKHAPNMENWRVKKFPNFVMAPTSIEPPNSSTDGEKMIKFL